jgi:glyoxylate/hydroxypyruvate/2-ketogluconate reductase
MCPKKFRGHTVTKLLSNRLTKNKNIFQMTSNKHQLLVARAIFPAVLDRLALHFDVESNQADVIFSSAELAVKLQDKTAAFTTGSERIDAALLDACPKLRVVANMAVGYNNFDVAACAARGVRCSNTPDVLTDTTADLGFALVLAAARRMAEGEALLRRGEWAKWSYDMLAGADVHGSTLGILGMGRIGQAVAKRGVHGFGMNLIYHNRSRLDAAIEQGLNARYVSKVELFAQADHIVLVLPYSAEAHHAVGKAELALMKPSATISNIGRGGLIDENALADVLSAGQILAAGLDVFEGEPAVNPRLLALNNVVLTPHIGSASVRTRLAMANLAADNLIAFAQGKELPTPIAA